MTATSTLLLVLLVSLLFVGKASAFGAGEVAGTSDFNGFVWRHGDIVEVLRYLPASFITHYRFTLLERRQIYFGNWLRDFSQVIDTTCLENLPEPALRAIVSVLGFMEFGFATDEFEVTRERLGCYTHVEHIDNPKGYADNAKDVDKRLRGPLDPRELEFDPNTGMKNYIANSGNGWDTAADYVRGQLRESIRLGRQGRKNDPAARKEAFIHLGAALHTLEDFSAHSNFTELCLRELGEDDVFPFVGAACRVKTPGWSGKMVPPVVTGTFGMLDIFHSLLGEADDMAVLQCKGSLENLETDLNVGAMAFDQLYELLKAAIQGLSSLASTTINDPLLKQLEAAGVLFKKAEEAKEQGQSVETSVDANILWQSIEPIFFLHDRLKKWLQESTAREDTEPLNQESSTQLGKYADELVFKYLSLMIEASIQQLRNALRAAKDRVDAEAAKSTSAEVYLDGDGSDPSHSDLSKDHFNNVLNQPAGLVATVTTNWTTQQVVRCYDDSFRDEEETIDEILSILHHPAFPGRSKTPVQKYMFEAVRGWWEHNSAEEQAKIRGKLTRDSVRARAHEDHTLTLKDLAGKKKGAAVFPGSRPKVRQPPKKPSPLTWAVAEAEKDAKWALGAARRGIRDPAAAAKLLGSGIYGAVAYTVWLTMATFRVLLGWMLALVSKVWSFVK
ncbi:heterokaryon incompatibility Het-C [Ilyonectria robusta]|uniref:heterokaryon incompatibility Het-C n=1 Tax=Ilyonectria robusta TaxID=1079257 RepID=UPI001E8D660C|nr:heterokaryon incompatibility Het-C [Ilyonectria robusta]KAH8738405.1 heterokaryon incompatibility Het-C [Ilyonectria robusta]